MYSNKSSNFKMLCKCLFLWNLEVKKKSKLDPRFLKGSNKNELSENLLSILYLDKAELLQPIEKFLCSVI